MRLSSLLWLERITLRAWTIHAEAAGSVSVAIVTGVVPKTCTPSRVASTTAAVPKLPRGPVGPVGPVGPTAPPAPGVPATPRDPASPAGPAGPRAPAGPVRPL